MPHIGKMIGKIGRISVYSTARGQWFDIYCDDNHVWGSQSLADAWCQMMTRSLHL